MPQPMTFAVAGYGAWGRFHARSIAGAADGRLVAIAARSDANARAAQSDFPDAAVHREWEALIRDPAIEAIAVATPNHLHAPIAVAALEAGKHVLLEKPMANTLADCDRIVAAVKRSKAAAQRRTAVPAVAAMGTHPRAHRRRSHRPTAACPCRPVPPSVPAGLGRLAL